MQEIAPGIVHWTAVHQGIHAPVSSYLIVADGVLLNPIRPPGGFESLAERYGRPTAVVLTNRHHYRDSAEPAERFDAVVHCHEAGLHAFTGGERVEPFAFGDTVPGGAVAQAVDAISPEETALWFPRERALAFADGLVRMPADAPLGFVPDDLMGDDAEAVKQGLRQALTRLAALQPEHLLLAHGDPWIGDGAAALRSFLDRSG